MIREDKRIKENNILRAEPGFVIAVLAVLILLIAAVTIQSALGLKTAVDRTTKAYVSDVAAQLALDIDDRLSLYQENNIIGVWGGTGNKESMQRLIQPVSFDGQGLTCIADTEGNVVISPTDLDPFMRLDDIFKEDSEETTVRNIKRMQENMKEGKNGVFSFVAVDGRELILSYNILKSYDWVLLTLVPADLISYETDIRISSQRNIADILYGRSCRRSYHTQSSDKFRNGLFIFLGKHSHFFQFSFQSKKTFVQNAFSFLGDLLCIKLITSVPLVNVHSSAHYHLISVFHAECQSAPVSGKHHAGKNSCLIFQRKINMSAWVIFTVGNLTLYIYLFQDKILKEHIFYIAVDLTYGINSFHFQFLLSSDDGCSFFF